MKKALSLTAAITAISIGGILAPAHAQVQENTPQDNIETETPPQREDRFSVPSADATNRNEVPPKSEGQRDSRKTNTPAPENRDKTLESLDQKPQSGNLLTFLWGIVQPFAIPTLLVGTSSFLILRRENIERKKLKIAHRNEFNLLKRSNAELRHQINALNLQAEHLNKYLITTADALISEWQSTKSVQSKSDRLLPFDVIGNQVINQSDTSSEFTQTHPLYPIEKSIPRNIDLKSQYRVISSEPSMWPGRLMRVEPLSGGKLHWMLVLELPDSGLETYQFDYLTRLLKLSESKDNFLTPLQISLEKQQIIAVTDLPEKPVLSEQSHITVEQGKKLLHRLLIKLSHSQKYELSPSCFKPESLYVTSQDIRCNALAAVAQVMESEAEKDGPQIARTVIQAITGLQVRSDEFDSFWQAEISLENPRLRQLLDDLLSDRVSLVIEALNYLIPNDSDRLVDSSHLESVPEISLILEQVKHRFGKTTNFFWAACFQPMRTRNIWQGIVNSEGVSALELEDCQGAEASYLRFSDASQDYLIPNATNPRLRQLILQLEQEKSSTFQIRVSPTGELKLHQAAKIARNGSDSWSVIEPGVIER